MFGVGYWPVPDASEPQDPMKRSLKPEKPDTWAGRENRVQWVMENFTDGELALLYKTTHDSRRIKIARDQCEAIIRKEKETFKK